MSPVGRVGGPEHEPSAQARAGARAMRDMFGALILEGFTEAQSLQLLGVMLATAQANPPKPE